MVKNATANASGYETWVRSLGQEDPLEEGMANPHHSSCLENPVDREAWGATPHSVAKRQTRLKRLSVHTRTPQTGPLHKLLFRLPTLQRALWMEPGDPPFLSPRLPPPPLIPPSRSEVAAMASALPRPLPSTNLFSTLIPDGFLLKCKSIHVT